MSARDESQELKEIWSQLEQGPKAGRLRPGLPPDDSDAEGFEYAFDNHFLPDSYWCSIGIHDGEEPGEGPGVHPKVRLVSLRESIDFETVMMNIMSLEDIDEEAMAEAGPIGDDELLVGIDEKPLEGSLRDAVIAERALYEVRYDETRAADSRIMDYGPGLEWTIAISADGHRIVIDLEPKDPEHNGQIIEYRPDGSIHWLAPNLVEWMRSLRNE